MKKIKFFVPALTLFLIISCAEEPKIEKVVPIQKNKALIIGDPFDYGVEDFLLFPVGANYKPNVIEPEKVLESSTESITGTVFLSFCTNKGALNDITAEEEYINANEDKFDIRNILFYNLKTETSYPLILDTLHILSFAVHKEFSKPLIFYRVVKIDNNKDSIFNSQDPVMLLISDIYGKNLKLVTPSDEKFVDFTYYKSTNSIIIKTILDSDGDNQFSNFDETNYREMNLLNPSIGREIFSKSLKDSLRNQLNNF